MAENSSTAKHFVLVHGACHGAWCWYKVVVLLEKHGHKVTALDLAASGRNFEDRLEDLRTVDDYHKPLYSFLESLPEDEDKVILVGHSNGCYAVSSAMERFPEKIDWGVFVSGYMLSSDLTIDNFAPKITGFDYVMDSEMITVEVNGKIQTHWTSGKRFLAANYYQNSPPEDLQLASLLVRPMRVFMGDDELRTPLLVSKEKFGSVRRAFIIGHAIEERAEKQRWNAEKNPPDMVTEIQGADHMIMFSKPQELCNFLLKIAQQAS